MSDTREIWQDNSPIPSLDCDQKQAVEFLVGKSLESLSEGNLDLILFPESNREFLGSPILTQNYKSDGGYEIRTTNLIGVLNYNKTKDVNVKISIGSRFDVDSNKQPHPKQPFLVYLLSQVFKGYLLDWRVRADSYDLWDILLFLLFAYQLEKSYVRGLFRQYVHSEYNESCFKGSLDVGRHLKNNTPFVGRIAYNLEEFTHDNPILWLVRHACNTLRKRNAELLGSVMNRRSMVSEAIRVISEATPSYAPQRRYQLYSKCNTPIRHPFFTQYEGLRKTCLQILRRDEGLNPYADDREEVSGVLFDVAWLWEEFVAKLLTDIGFKHHLYGQPDDRIFAFEKPEQSCPFYPDFTKGDAVVLDAKYKRAGESWNTDDVHQILSYMYLTGANIGGVIYPAAAGTDSKIKPFITGGRHKGRWLNIPLGIPSCGDNFRAQMDANVQGWKANVRQWLERAQ
jgi:5-methylcytosine-specific restriction enzyme subunit McrC